MSERDLTYALEKVIADMREVMAWVEDGQKEPKPQAALDRLKFYVAERIHTVGNA